MGRKKAGLAPICPKTSRPFCYFCDRTFDDENILIQHQRAKHFRCLECDDTAVRGKCESVQGLIVHTLKVHSKSLARVPNALQGRDSPELDIYGMDGVPSDVLRQRGIEQHQLVGKAVPPPSAPPPGFTEPMPCLQDSMMLGLPMPPVPGAPSLEGFQQFLAAQKVSPPAGPTVPPGLQQPSSNGGDACALSALAGGFIGTGFQPQGAPLPPTMSPANGHPSQLLPHKRSLEEMQEAGDDVSVEERRALLNRYREPR